MTSKNELLELARAQQGDTVVEKALSRYNRAASEMIESARLVKMWAEGATDRVLVPSMQPYLDATGLTAAGKLATAERMAWEALFDIAAGLQEAGVEVDW